MQSKVITTMRADSRFVSNQWETALLCNVVSHWLGASLESVLTMHMLRCETTIEAILYWFTVSFSMYTTIMQRTTILREMLDAEGVKLIVKYNHLKSCYIIKYFNITVISHERHVTSFHFEHGHLFINLFVVITMVIPKPLSSQKISNTELVFMSWRHHGNASRIQNNLHSAIPKTRRCTQFYLTFQRMLPTRCYLQVDQN